VIVTGALSNHRLPRSESSASALMVATERPGERVPGARSIRSSVAVTQATPSARTAVRIGIDRPPTLIRVEVARERVFLSIVRS
jgi:hypothetical protein